MVTSVPCQLHSSGRAREERPAAPATPSCRLASADGPTLTGVRDATDAPATRAGRGRSRSARSRTAGTASPGTTAGWSSSGTPCRASGCGVAHHRGQRRRPVPARRRRRGARAVAGPGRAAAARTPVPDAAAAATSSTSTWPAQRAAQGRGGAPSSCSRLAGIDWSARSTVEAVPGDDDGLGWRTRVRYAVDAGRSAGLRQHRSHDVRAGRRLPDRAPGHAATSLDRTWAGAPAVEAVGSPTGRHALLVDRGGRTRGAPWSRARRRPRLAGGRRGFWQVHPGAADTLVDAVLDGARARSRGSGRSTSTAGVGLFAGGAGRRGRPGRARGRRRGRPAAVERRRGATCADLPQVSAAAGPGRPGAGRTLPRGRPGRARPAAHRRRRRRGRARSPRLAPAGGRLRRLRPGGAGPGPGDLRRATATELDRRCAPSTCSR